MKDKTAEDILNLVIALNDSKLKDLKKADKDNIIASPMLQAQLDMLEILGNAIQRKYGDKL